MQVFGLHNVITTTQQMDPPTLHVSRSQLKHLEVIRRCGSEHLKSIVASLRAQKEDLPFSRAELENQIAAAGIAQEEANVISLTVLSMVAVTRDVEAIGSQAVLEGFLAGVRAVPEPDRWTDAEIAEWESLIPVLGELMDTDAVKTASKALDLSYDYGKLWRGGRILTDIRPIFSDDAERIHGALVSFTLRLRYDDDEGIHSESLAMDRRDVLALIEQCKRALIKADCAQSNMARLTKTKITGSDDGD